MPAVDGIADVKLDQNYVPFGPLADFAVLCGRGENAKTAINGEEPLTAD